MQSQEGLSFWDHLDVLRSVLIKIVAIVGVLMVVAFCFKQQLFDVVLAPTKFCTRAVRAPSGVRKITRNRINSARKIPEEINRMGKRSFCAVSSILGVFFLEADAAGPFLELPLDAAAF